MLNSQLSVTDNNVPQQDQCIRCGCIAEGDDKAGGHVCQSCDEMDGDISGENNRVDAMPDVVIHGFWKYEQSMGSYACKIGQYPADLNDDENESDQSIFNYFESEESISKGVNDFIVTSYEINEKNVFVSQGQIQSQMDIDHVTVFFEKYQPIENTSNTACFESDDKFYGFETFGSDLEKVKAANPKQIWTVVESEVRDGTVIVNGMRYCNRVFYIITENEWKDGDQIAIPLM